MWREELILNKIFAIIMILIGALLVPVEWDATFFLFTLIVGGYLFFAKRNWIVLWGNGYGKSRTKKSSARFLKSWNFVPSSTVSWKRQALPFPLLPVPLRPILMRELCLPNPPTAQLPETTLRFKAICLQILRARGRAFLKIQTWRG